MPRSESLLGRAFLRAVSLQPRAEETLEIRCLPSVRGLVVDCGLVFEKYIISVNSIRDGATTSRRVLGATHFRCEIGSPSMLTSNLCAGSMGFLVLGSTGLFTLAYSASWTAVKRSKFCFRCFFSLRGPLFQQRIWKTTKGDNADSRVFGHSSAAFRIYSGPSTYLFHRWIAFRWSLPALNSEASSLQKLLDWTRTDFPSQIGIPESIVRAA
jgi:hypothetical protein